MTKQLAKNWRKIHAPLCWNREYANVNSSCDAYLAQTGECPGTGIVPGHFRGGGLSWEKVSEWGFSRWRNDGGKMWGECSIKLGKCPGPWWAHIQTHTHIDKQLPFDGYTISSANAVELLTLADGCVVGPLSETSDVGITDDAEAAHQLVAMVTAERTRAAVSVDGWRAVTWPVDRSARIRTCHRWPKQQRRQWKRCV